MYVPIQLHISVCFISHNTMQQVDGCARGGTLKQLKLFSYFLDALLTYHAVTLL